MIVHHPGAAHLLAALIPALPALILPDSLLEIDKGRREIIQKMINLICMKMAREWSRPRLAHKNLIGLNL